MIEVTDKRLVNTTLVADLEVGDACMHNGDLLVRANGDLFKNMSGTRLPFVSLTEGEFGEIVYVDVNYYVQQVTLHVEIHNL